MAQDNFENYLKDGILILFFTVIAFLNCYYYELGSCSFYHIPTEFITIEITSQGKLIFLFITTICCICLVIDNSIGACIRLAKRIPSHLFTFFLFAVIIVAIIFVKLVSNKYLLLPLTNYYYIGGSTLFALMLWIYNTPNPEKLNLEIVDPKFSIGILISKRYGKWVAPLILILTLSCTISSQLGYYNAKNQTEYFAKASHPQTVLIKKYGDFTVSMSLTRDSMFDSKPIIEKSMSTDTFQLITIPIK